MELYEYVLVLKICYILIIILKKIKNYKKKGILI